MLVRNTHPFNDPLSGSTRVSRYQKGKTNPDFTEARDSEWQWHQLSHMQVCTSLQTDNHASTLPLMLVGKTATFFLQYFSASINIVKMSYFLKQCKCLRVGKKNGATDS